MTEVPATQTLFEQALSALEVGEPERVIELCDKIIELDAGHQDAVLLKAEAYRDLRQPHEAEAMFRAALKINDQRSEAWSGLGAVLFDLCRFEASRRAFLRSIRLQPHNADALYGRALLRERRGDERGARRDYLRAWRLSRHHPPPVPLSDDEVRSLLDEAAADADPGIAAFMHQAPLILRETPDEATCNAYEPPASPAELLGHLATQHFGGLSSVMLPPSVVVFRRNVQRFADDRENLVKALRDTVVVQLEDWIGQAAVSE